MSTTAPRESPSAAAVYVYGVVARGSEPALADDGVAGGTVGLVQHGDLAALVSAMPSEQLRVRRRDLVSHLAVLERAFAATTIVPCSFGTVLASEEAVRNGLLGARGDELHALLRRLEGHVQLNVRARYDEDVLLRQIVAGDTGLQRLSERTVALGEAGYYERIRLGELVAAAVADRRAREEQALYARLAPLAREIAPDEAGDEVLKASFLVARNGLAGFDAELEGIAAEQDGLLRLESIGPLPPTAFARLEEARWGS